jgi:hypothetical protein
MTLKFVEKQKPFGPAPYRRPRDAATLILLRKTGDAPEVLMGRRAKTLVFMPACSCFPADAPSAPT